MLGRDRLSYRTFGGKLASGIRAVILVTVAIATVAASPESNRPAPSSRKANQPPQSQSTSPNQPSAPDQRGTEQSPLVVKSLPPPNADEEARRQQEERENKSSADWWMVRLTGVIGLIGF